jgi:hypothetical protein
MQGAEEREGERRWKFFCIVSMQGKAPGCFLACVHVSVHVAESLFYMYVYIHHTYAYMDSIYIYKYEGIRDVC